MTFRAITLTFVFAALAIGCDKGGGSSAAPVAIGVSSSSGSAASSASVGAPGSSLEPRAVASVPANGTPFPIASVTGVVNPDAVPPYTGPVGSIEGTVRVIGEGPKRVPFSAAEKKKCKDTLAGDAELSFREDPLEGGARGLRDVLVYAINYDGFIAERDAKENLSIKGCAYSARTLDVTFGQGLVVKNEDSIPYAPSLAKSPNPMLNLLTPNASGELYPRELGPLALGVRVGPSFVRATVYVLPQPLHTVSGKDGKFRLDGVPIGPKIGLRFRHPAFSEEVGREVEVRNGLIAHAEAELRAGDAAAP